jgi:hypothetical protein
MPAGAEMPLMGARGQGEGYARKAKARECEADPYDPAVLAAEAEKLARSPAGRRRRSIEGCAWVVGWSKALFREIAPGIVSDHKWFHRGKNRRGCDVLCVARELYLYCLCCFEGTMPARAMPLTAILIPRIEQLLGITIRNRASFHRHCTRALRSLRAALRVPEYALTATQRRPLGCYPHNMRVLKSSRQAELSSDKMTSAHE